MAPRLELQAILETMADNVYFQPPANISMKYPCIIYHRDFMDTLFADNNPYSGTKRYLVTVVDRNPDSPIPDKVAKLPMCMFQNFYASDDLNHDVYSLYF